MGTHNVRDISNDQEMLTKTHVLILLVVVTNLRLPWLREFETIGGWWDVLNRKCWYVQYYLTSVKWYEM